MQCLPRFAADVAGRGVLAPRPSRQDSATRDRLTQLRAELKRDGLTGFIVPHADEHQSEYLPPSAERLAWLTGFTGSAGAAVVLADEAAVFVDGRYTIQAAAEVDAAAFALEHLIENPPWKWLKARLKPGDRIGYDPWLMTAAEVDAPRGGLPRRRGDAGPRLRQPDRPDLGRPAGAAARRGHACTRSNSPARKRATRSPGSGGRSPRRRPTPPSSPRPIPSPGPSISAAADIAHNPVALAYAILPAEGPAVALHRRAEALEQRPGDARRSRRTPRAGRVRRRPRRARPRGRTGAPRPEGHRRGDRRRDPRRRRHRGRGRRPGRAAQGAEERDRTRRHPPRPSPRRRRDGALPRLARPRGGRRRRSTRSPPTAKLAEFRADTALRDGSELVDLSFATISGAGPNGAIVHYRVTPATNRRLEPGSLYLVDSGGQYRDGTTDITRTVAIGTPTAEMRDRFTRVLKGHIAIATARFPVGTTGAQLDTLARAALWQAGLDYDHGTGHGVGSFLAVHEGPARISKLGTVPLEPGMILSERARLLQARRLRHPHREPRRRHARRADPGRRPADARLRDADARADRPAADRRRRFSPPAEIAWLDAYHARLGPALDRLLDDRRAALARARDRRRSRK